MEPAFKFLKAATATNSRKNAFTVSFCHKFPTRGYETLPNPRNTESCFLPKVSLDLQIFDYGQRLSSLVLITTRQFSESSAILFLPDFIEFLILIALALNF